MIKKSIKFTDFDGNEVVEDHYFHLSMKELTHMELGPDGGMYDKLTAILESGNGGKIIGAFEDIIRRAYGQREDNRPTHFLKTDEIADSFMNSLAYDALFSELLQDSTAMGEFINGLIPSELMNSAEMKKAMAEAQQQQGRTIASVNLERAEISVPELTREQIDAATGLNLPRDKDHKLVPWANRPPTPKEQTEMTKAQLVDCMRRQQSDWKPTTA